MVLGQDRIAINNGSEQAKKKATCKQVQQWGQRRHLNEKRLAELSKEALQMELLGGRC